jgi:hypothetical protein
MIEILYIILFNGLPLIILIIPLFFIWKKYLGKVYFRIILGIITFYLVYWILPIIFQLGEEPDNLTVKGGYDYILGILYLFAHMGSLIALFSYYPLVTLPFIFFVAPFLSFIFLWNHLRKAEGSIKDNLNKLTYEYSISPYDKIRRDILKNDWSREKDILKLMIVFAPISLYLLQVILDISNLQNISLTRGETALGWFIEILFVYLAIFILSIELLFSSKIEIEGRYFGEKIRQQTFKSLYLVGAPISFLSIILFSIQYTQSLPIIIYFLAYFIMASIIFVLFLRIFEPISLLILIKLINWWKNKGIKTKPVKKSKWYYATLLGFIAAAVYFIFNLVIILLFSLFGTSQGDIINSGKYTTQNPTLLNSYRFDMLIIFTTIALVVVPLIIILLSLAYSFKYVRSFYKGFIAFFLPVIILSLISIMFRVNPLINFMPDEYWVTGKISYTYALGFKFYTLRTAAFSANLFPGGKISLLGVLAIPYLYTRYIFSIVIWTFMILYYKKGFKTKHTPIDEKLVEKTINSSVRYFITYDDFYKEEIQFLISINKDIIKISLEHESEEVRDLLNSLENDKLLHEIIPNNPEDKKNFYFTLKYLFLNNQIRIWKPEFSFIYEKVEKQGLYIMYPDGRDVFNFAFSKESLPDPGLISGMFSAITSFIKETTKSTELLKTIDHGDITILIEHGQIIFGILFIKGTQSSEIRDHLIKFINQFETKHKDVLPNWTGILKPFKEDNLLVEEIFKEE